MKLNEAVRTDAANSVLCWLATVGEDGVPSVTPKEIFACHGDDRIVIADIASSGSLRNIAVRPAVCVSFVDIFRQRGFKIAGTAEIVARDHPEFSSLAVDLLRMAGSGFPIRNVVSVRVLRISRIWAPSYALFPSRSEEERMRDAYETYGVHPSERGD